MVVNGRVKNGVVILNEPGRFPEGAEVRVESITSQSTSQPSSSPTSELSNGQTLSQKLLRHAGTCRGLPSDLADQHDHYVHGTPKT